MGLPTPRLDDKTFIQLMEDVRKLIPRYAREWTDFNTSDPGITFFELFASLTEQQRYYLDQIDDKSILKFLKLLGIYPKPAIAAQAEVTFSGKTNLFRSILVPKGTKLSTRSVNNDEPQLIFETEAPLWVVPARLDKIISVSSIELQDNTAINQIDGLSFAAFGEENSSGDRSLYLGFNLPSITKQGTPFPPGKGMALTVNLFEDYPVKLGQHNDEIAEVIPSIQLEWEYFQADQWLPLEILKDETCQLTRSGRLWFKSPDTMTANVVFPSLSQALYWIRVRIKEGDYEIPPRIDAIRLNTISAIQHNSFCKATTFSSNGQLTQTFPASYLTLAGENIQQTNTVQVRDRSGDWQDLDSVSLTPDPENSQITIAFTSANVPLAGENNLRLISSQLDFRSQLSLGQSNGLPNQRFQLDPLPVVADQLALQVLILRGTSHAHYWQDWTQVPDLDASKPTDSHYIVEQATGQLQFGDGINGAIPAVLANDTDNLRLCSYQTCQGALGNVSIGKIDTVVESPMIPRLAELTVTNAMPAIGGTDPETLEFAQLRARKQLKVPTRAVTSEDFEFLALATPGLRVARAKAIPFVAQSGEKKDPPRVIAAPKIEMATATLRPSVPKFRTEAIVPPHVTVVVVPYSPAQIFKPTPSKGFLKTVCLHLDRHRLITTKVEVIAPNYVGVGGNTTLRLRRGFSEVTSQEQVDQTLKAFLHPLEGGTEGKGWEFGRTVYRSEIYQVLEAIPSVDCVQRVDLNFQGVGATRDADGNIAISPQSLVYSLDHQIEVINPEATCRSGEGLS